MALEVAGPAQDDRHTSLDGPPPLPTGGGGRKATLMDQQPKGLGADAGNPQIMALQGLQLMEKGAQLLVQGFPALQDPLGQVVAFVRQAVPQAMTGGNPMQVPAAAGPPGGGGMPMAPPPPPGGPPPGPGM